MRRINTSSFNQVCWIFTLILSLVFAQFAGLQHRIDHAGWQGNREFSGQDIQLVSKSAIQFQTDGGKTNSGHSCALVDASTLADTFGATPCIVALVDAGDPAPHSTSIASWDAPVVHHFLSRAPPPVAI